MNRFLLISIYGFLLLASCSENHQAGMSADTGINALNADSLREHISILASDSFMGRKPFTEGEVRTITFLQQKFAATGLEPGNGNSYLQEVPMVNIQTSADSIMRIQSPKGNYLLTGLEDYVIWTEKTDPVISIHEDELVFAGYGVNAPERNWNDYEGLDVKGKIVLVLVNDPGYGINNELFKGDTMTYYGRWTYKFEEAARQGAKGCLVIHETKAASYPFTVVQNNWNGSRLHLDDRGKDVPYCDMVGWVSNEAAKKLFTSAGYDSSIMRKAAEPGFKGFSLKTRLTTSIKVSATYNKSYNVIGKITGATKPGEYVIYTAHWDHLGIGKPDETGDSIYNGALDNASATAGLIELARAFKNSKTKPDRTIIFLAVTAEEQGLWGSAWYAQNPVYPAENTVANINMDGLNNLGKAKDIIIIGQGQSELEDILKEVADDLDREISFDTHPEAGYYYRSDHFNFAKVGIPSLYTGSVIDIIGKGKDYGRQKDEEYTGQHYHRPSDEFNENYNVEGSIEDLKLLFLVGKRIAVKDVWPGWKEGSEFKALRNKDRKANSQ